MTQDPTYRALVVDDETATRELTIRALSYEGFSCNPATDGYVAEQRLSQGHYDLVVTDLKMPNKNGHALVVELLQKQTRPAVVVLTGVLEPRLAKDLISRGVDAIEFKPVDYALFAAKTKAIVIRRESPANEQNADDDHSAYVRSQSKTLKDDDQDLNKTRVADVMVREVHTVTATSTMREVAKTIAAQGVRHLPIVNAKRELVGIITQRDLFRHMGQLFNVDEKIAHASVGAYMSTALESISPTTLISDAAHTMLSERIGCLPVIDDRQRLVGILTRSDLLRQLVELSSTAH